jgi:penicillin-insensitive murein endopeptidase
MSPYPGPGFASRRWPILLLACAALLLGGADGPERIIGGPATGGCLTGAIQLPTRGEGFETIHLQRSSFWGAPGTIQRIELLGRQAHDAGLPELYVEDISRRFGGPLPGGHLSHQVGLDADVGLDMRPRPPLWDTAREQMELPSLVRPDGRGVVPERWSSRVIMLLQLAAGLPDVDRVLVNPAIKQQLCEDVTGDRSWLRLIRPWYGHAAHMHIRFRCPAGQAECQQQPPPPEGDGCDASLQWWFDQLDHPTRPSGPQRVPTPPAACRAILARNG